MANAPVGGAHTPFNFDSSSAYIEKKHDLTDSLPVTSAAPKASAPYDDKFLFDMAGNRTLEQIDNGNNGTTDATDAYTYNGDDQLKTETRTGDGAYAITNGYDNNGSLTSQNKTGNGAENDSYSYDARNRMTLATVNGVTTTYGYDDNGVRVSETTDGVATYYLNDPQNPTGYTKAIEESTTVNGSPTRAYVLGLNVIAQSDSANGLLYLLKDGHGSARALLDSFGAIVEQYNYDAFGTLLASAGAQSDASAALTDWLFAGDGIKDPATGWAYHLSRFTDGFWFTSMDPRTATAGDVGNANLHLYVGGDSINLTDVSGRDFSMPSLSVTMGIGATLGGIVGGTDAALGGGSWGDIGISAAEGLVLGAAGGAAIYYFPALFASKWAIGAGAALTGISVYDSVRKGLYAQAVERAALGLGGLWKIPRIAGLFSDVTDFLDQMSVVRVANNIKVGNVAQAEVDVGNLQDTFIAASGDNNFGVQLPADTNFNTFKVDGYDRVFDAERKALEYIASQLPNRDVDGTIKLFSERPICDSCMSIVRQFRAMFPNIDLQYYAGRGPIKL